LLTDFGPRLVVFPATMRTTSCRIDMRRAVVGGAQGHSSDPGSVSRSTFSSFDPPSLRRVEGA